MNNNTANERTVSLNILCRIFDNKAYNAIAISEELDKQGLSLDKSKRAFVTELVNGVLRNLTLLDHIIAQFSKTPVKKLKPLVLNVLRQAVYELLFMSAPQYAVCAEAVDIIKKRKLLGLAPFVNGVLRNIARGGDDVKYLNLPDKTECPAEYLSVFYSHPDWLVRRWLREYGFDFTRAMLEKNNEPPDVSVCVNTLKTDRDALFEAFGNNGVCVRKSELCENALLIKGAGDIKRLDAYKNGLFHVQDIASQLAVKALNPLAGEVVADLCAAPGGKSYAAAYLMENKGKILAFDLHPHKIKLVNDGAKRLGIDIISAETGDSSKVDERLLDYCVRVLVDAPCTGFGLIRKKPDIKLNRRESDILELQKVQRGILSVGARYVKIGGVLLYSTCTVTKEENEDNVSWFLENGDFEQTEEGSVSLFPHVHETDGFFIAKFKRVR